MTPVFTTAFDYQDFTFFIVLNISGRFIMVKGTIIEEICNTLYAIWEEKRGKAWRFGKIIVNLQLENKD